MEKSLVSLLGVFLDEQANLIKQQSDRLKQLVASGGAGGQGSSANHVLSSDAEDAATGKRGKKKVKKDPNAPKRPASAYNLFFIEHAAPYKADHPDFKQKEVMTEIGHMWSVLPEKSKEKYKHKAEQLKAKYGVEYEAYYHTKRPGAPSTSAGASAAVESSDSDDDESGSDSGDDTESSSSDNTDFVPAVQASKKAAAPPKAAAQSKAAAPAPAAAKAPVKQPASPVKTPVAPPATESPKRKAEGASTDVASSSSKPKHVKASAPAPAPAPAPTPASAPAKAAKAGAPAPVAAAADKEDGHKKKKDKESKDADKEKDKKSKKRDLESAAAATPAKSDSSNAGESNTDKKKVSYCPQVFSVRKHAVCRRSTRKNMTQRSDLVAWMLHCVSICLHHCKYREMGASTKHYETSILTNIYRLTLNLPYSATVTLYSVIKYTHIKICSSLLDMIRCRIWPQA
jgi:hypothetical protein